MSKRSNNKGFSLIELIVVVAIMAVLVGVLAPAYLNYVDKTRLQKDVSAVGEVLNAIEVAATDEINIKDLVQEQIQNNGTVNSGAWTYLMFDGGNDSGISNIVVNKVSGNAATNLQAALYEIVGRDIEFARPEVQSVDLRVLVSYDKDYKIITKVDVSVFEEGSDVEKAFKEAFDCTVGASTQTQIAELRAEIGTFVTEARTYLSEHSKEVSDYATILAYEAAGPLGFLVPGYKDLSDADKQAAREAGNEISKLYSEARTLRDQASAVGDEALANGAIKEIVSDLLAAMSPL